MSAGHDVGARPAKRRATLTFAGRAPTFLKAAGRRRCPAGGWVTVLR
jgi:hypothetical protein